mgnify:FL=1|tara:strand:- start:16076 stop:16870 length:795 start_codon:yes stop_codon:yes gene_type:complete
MSKYEKQYNKIAKNILKTGELRNTRSGWTYSLPFQELNASLKHNMFPLLTCREIFYKGVAGEYAAMIRGPKNIKDFQKWGCNYWNEWGDISSGDLRLDYGNLWIDYNGINQIEELIKTIKYDPHSRRLLINGWRPNNNLSLPCCHYSYQFYVSNNSIDLLWTQRSGDWMVGVPSDMTFAAIMLICIANLCDLTPRNIKMIIGDAHIYLEHKLNAKLQIEKEILSPPMYSIQKQLGESGDVGFMPTDLEIINYKNQGKLKYDLKK